MKIKASDIFKTNEGGSATVVEYIDSRNVLIEYNDKYKHRAIVKAGLLRAGKVKNPYFPSVYGVGFIGVGAHTPSANGKQTRAYISWQSMIGRCYSNAFQSRFPTYLGCTVAVEWHNFQVYADWFFRQANSNERGFDLDKDLLVFGNKVYSEASCSFVPQAINKILTDRAGARGKYPQGVSAHYRKGYRAYLCVNGKQINLGTRDTPEQAYEVYKKAKEKIVRSAAVEWKDYLHSAVYANLAEWSL